MDIVWLHAKGKIWDSISNKLQEDNLWKKVIKRIEKPTLSELKTLKTKAPLSKANQMECERFYDILLKKSFLLLDMLFRKTDWKTDRYNNLSFHEIYYRIRIYFEFYTHILKKEKVSLVVFYDTPHMGWDYILYETAKFFNIKTLILEQSRFPNKFFHFFEYMDYGKFETSKILDNMETYPIERKVEKEWFYMKDIGIQKPEITLEKLLSFSRYKNRLKIIIESNDFLRLFGELCIKQRRPQSFFRFYTERDYKKKLKKTVSTSYSLENKFVYFPLHYQPEKNATAWSGVYIDQVLAIERLSQLLPDDWFIYVKENPKQKGAYRNKLFFERLKLLPNTRLLSHGADTFRLIKMSQFVATITGTVAYEAVTGGKNALIFGWGAWYQSLPGIHRYHDQMDIHNLTIQKIDHDLLQKRVAQLLNRCGTGVIREQWTKPVKDFTIEKNAILVATALKKILYG